MLKLDLNRTFEKGCESLKTEIQQGIEALIDLQHGVGLGSDYTGWMKLPSSISPILLDDIILTAKKIRETSNTVVVVGVGGSYLGTRAVIEAFKPVFEKEETEILYAGHHLDADYYSQILDYLKTRSWSIVAISKSGTTTEPAIAFRLLRDAHVEQFGLSEANNRTVAVTDQSEGALRNFSTQYNIKAFEIPRNVGGRYSVLSPVGLLPIAIAGVDIKALIAGAADGEMEFNKPTESNIAVMYAAARNKLYVEGKKIEIMVAYNPQLFYFSEWWKQLFAESEGKENKGLFVSRATFTTDLHSLGQYIQQGERHLFETFLSIEETPSKIEIKANAENIDELNYLAGNDLHCINKTAMIATLSAHTEGGVPNILLSMQQLDAFAFGKLIYFFEISCAISGYMLGVNPFDQPGVENYKNNMYALLGKPGFEKHQI